MKSHYILLLTAACIGLSNCIPVDPPQPNGCQLDGWGTLSVTNASLNTVQKIRIGGTNYGTIDPGESKQINLPVGEYEFQFVGVSGGSGCSVSTINIPDCGALGRSCSN